MSLLDEFEAVLLEEEAPVALSEGCEVVICVSIVSGDTEAFVVDASDNACVMEVADIVRVPLVARLVSIGLYSNLFTLY